MSKKKNDKTKTNDIKTYGIDETRNKESFLEFARGVYGVCSQERGVSENGEFDYETAYKQIRAHFLEFEKFRLELQAANQRVLNSVLPNYAAKANRP